MTQIMCDEYKEEFPDLENDPNAKMAFKSSFSSYKSESIDYFLEHHDTYPITLVLFYNENEISDIVMRSLAAKLLDIFVFKNEKRFK